MLEFRKAKFVKSATCREECPVGLPEIIFIGKSNVGKSSLINALCDNKSLAFTSSKPGHTRLLNYFDINNQCFLVDAPGYGYSSAGKHHTILFGDMMEDFFKNDTTIKGVIFLVDSRRELNEEDTDFYQFLLDNQLPFVVVMTKCDKLNQSDKAKLVKNVKSAFSNIDLSKIINTSIKDVKSLELLKKQISSFIK